MAWSGQFEYLQRAERRMALVVPATLLLIAMIVYLSRRSLAETLIVLCGAPFALTGAVWLLYALDYNLSVAVWVGMIALAGLYAGNRHRDAAVPQPGGRRVPGPQPAGPTGVRSPRR